MTFYTQYSFREAIKQTNVPSPNGQQWYVALDENGQYFINFSRWRHLFYIKYMYSVLSPKSKFDFQVGVGASLMFLFSESRESWDSISQVKAKKVRWNDSFYGLTSLHGFEKMYLNADITLFYKLSPKIKLGLGYSPIFAFDPYHYDSRIEHSIISKIYIKI